MNFLELTRGAHPVRGGSEYTPLDLALEPCNPDHEKFIEVV